MSETTRPETKTVRLLFLGRRRGRSGKPLWRWYKLGPDENDGSQLRLDSDRESLYGGKLLYPAAAPGTIISIETTVDGASVYRDTAAFAGVWDNADDVTKWAAEHRSVENDIASERQAVKKLKESLPAERLVPFRRAYRAANSREQAQILAFVVQEITRW